MVSFYCYKLPSFQQHFEVFHQSWFVMLPLLFVLNCFLNFFWLYFFDPFSVQGMVFNIHIFVHFLVFLLLILCVIPLQSENILTVISVFSNLLRLVLWPNTPSIQKMFWVHFYSCIFEWNDVHIFQAIWFKVQYQFKSSVLIYYRNDLPIVKSRGLKTTGFVLLLMSLFRFY